MNTGIGGGGTLRADGVGTTDDFSVRRGAAWAGIA